LERNIEGSKCYEHVETLDADGIVQATEAVVMRSYAVSSFMIFAVLKFQFHVCFKLIRFLILIRLNRHDPFSGQVS